MLDIIPNIARRKGIKINDKLIIDEKKIVNKSDFKDGDYIKISYGKKKHFIIKST